ncbi:ComEC/Rec2 family competence protein [Photobacterium leiognathi]|uniref:ComEC/Rec2 family competence protein n=1 Tax=Photobacterium leiognathi TaxID=553611 RepID=UPI002735294D|nr:MBL fold metallo-hydrolase [Photobacterium leiognathi]
MSQLIIQFINAGVGDCILLTDQANNKKILIDSGPSKGPGRAIVTHTLMHILGDNKDIDLAILTHNDDDHIGGFEGLLKSNIIRIKKILFNTVAQLESDIFIDSGKASYRQDLNLYKTITETNIDIESLVVREDSFNTIEIGDITLRFISPNQSKMKKLKDWAQKEKKLVERKEEERLKNNKKSSNNIVYNNLNDAIQAILLEDIFEPDTRAPNGSSFAFILEYAKHRLLFLGDCHMDIIEEYFLDKEAPQYFDLVKLSHHSSEHNNSQEFFNLIECENFVVCSDGVNNHGHPSMKTIARLSKNFPHSLIHFTSDSESIKNFAQSFQERCRFPKDNILEFTYDLSK